MLTTYQYGAPALLMSSFRKGIPSTWRADQFYRGRGDRGCGLVVVVVECVVTAAIVVVVIKVVAAEVMVADVVAPGAW